MPNGRAHLALRGLRERFRGQVVLPGDHGYERARAVWNATFALVLGWATWVAGSAVLDASGTLR